MSFLQHVAAVGGSLPWRAEKEPSKHTGANPQKTDSGMHVYCKASQRLSPSFVAQWPAATACREACGVKMRGARGFQSCCAASQAPPARLACISLQSRLPTSSSPPKFCGWDSMIQHGTERHHKANV